MASLHKMLGVSRDLGVLCSRLSKLQTKCSAPLIAQSTRGLFAPTASAARPAAVFGQHRFIHSTAVRPDLMQFFDDKKHWGQQEVKSGRSWTLDELRIKSNGDLHKLWFVLLKEKNMLLTMEHECNSKVEVFPSPERIDKVEESMERLETVVRERNRAYHLLETGVDGERPGRLVNNQLGMRYFYRESEHNIPQHMNRKWRETHVFRYSGAGVQKFRKLLHEKLYNVKRRSKNRDRNHVMHLLRRNPNLSRSLLAERYPHVDISKLVREDKIRGHYVPPL